MRIIENYETGIIDQYIANWKKKGYDIDGNSPKTESCPLLVVAMNYFKEDSGDYDFMMSKLQAIVDIINVEILKEKYEVKELVKDVHVRDLPFLEEEIDILKFNVSEVHTNEVKTVEAALYDDGYARHFELKEWRFKLGSPETPPEPPSPETPSPETPSSRESPSPEGPSALWNKWDKLKYIKYYKVEGDDDDDDEDF